LVTFGGLSESKFRNMKMERPAQARTLPKAPTGIAGLDEITSGGLPRGRPSLVCGGPGCGKTLFAAEFLIRGATQFGEPGAFISFEETGEELAQNIRSLGFDLDRLSEEKKIALDYVRIEPAEIVEAGEFDLEGLFVRLGLAIDSVGAKRIVLDTIESLFGGFTNQALLRAELRRLFRYLKDRGVTAVITGERGEGSLTRQGLEEYVSDCVILLDHRVNDQVSTRRMRIVKYRGSTHGTNEYPFLIDERGISVLPVTGLGLDHTVSDERVPTGIPRLDTMLGGKGYYRGSSVLVSGTAGTGKTSIAAHFAHETARRGERVLYLAFEESPSQLMRNMRSIGIDLQPLVKKGLIRIHASRPTLHGLEMHLVQIHKMISELEPGAVIVDPISNFVDSGSERDAHSMLLRLVDLLKAKRVTAMFTHLTSGASAQEATDVGISSLIDTWLLLRDIESAGERNRGLYVLKSRGMKHSNQIREFIMSPEGIELEDVYVGPEGVLTGSMRAAQEAREAAEALVQGQELARKQREIERRRAALEAQIATLRAEFKATEDEAELIAAQGRQRESTVAAQRMAAGRRGADAAPNSNRKAGRTK
jgi:circadian clock protein KaiC